MDKIYDGKYKQTRVRLNPIKKWTLPEEKALIKFLINNSNVEKPTAQAYYRRFIEESNLDIAWKTVRSKVKNMRNGYYRAKAWGKTQEAVNLTEQQLESVLLRKCNYYHELDGIFGSHFMEFASREGCLSSENSNLLTSITIDSDNSSHRSDEYNDYNFPSLSEAPAPEVMEIRPDLAQLKSHQLDQGLDLKCIEMGVKEKELNIQEKISIMEIVLKEKRLELKEKQILSKEKIKIYEINSKERLKILELEMQERLSMEELKLKYK